MAWSGAAEVENGLQMRVYDLREWHMVVARCWRCGHGGQVPLRLLKTGRRASLKLVDATMSMRCTQCGVRGIQQITVYKLPRNL